MKLSDLIKEAPIAGYKTLSDKPSSKRGDPSQISKDPTSFDKRSSSFTDKRDRRLVTSETSVKRLKNLFEKTTEDFYFYMVNTKEARDHTEIGFVDNEWLEKNMPAVAPHIEDHDDGITVIYTNNKGAEKIPMTPWIVAHRMAHAFSRYERSFNRMNLRHITEYSTAEEAINGITKDILRNNYGYHGEMRDAGLLRKKFFEEIGTFRSARKKKLRADFEFLNELFAQYLITGEVEFNPLPKKIVMSKAWGHDAEAYYLRGDVEGAQSMLDMLSRDFEYYVESMLSQAIGKKFVM
jgi:hypothetical protein